MRRKWSEAEIERLKELQGRCHDAALADELHRSVASIRRMKRLLVANRVKKRPWTEPEVQRLKRQIGVASPAEIARAMGRTPKDIVRKVKELAAELRTGSWSPGDIQELKLLYGTRTDEDLSIILSRSLESVLAVARRLCLAKDKTFLRRLHGAERPTPMPRWRKEELAQLQRLYPTHSNLEIAQRLERTVKSVVSKAHYMGLKKAMDRLREMGRENVKLRHGRE